MVTEKRGNEASTRGELLLMCAGILQYTAPWEYLEGMTPDETVSDSKRNIILFCLKKKKVSKSPGANKDPLKVDLSARESAKQGRCRSSDMFA